MADPAFQHKTEEAIEVYGLLLAVGYTGVRRLNWWLRMDLLNVIYLKWSREAQYLVHRRHSINV